MQLIRYLLSNFYLNLFRASLCPSSGEQDRVLLHMFFCTGCAGGGCVGLGRKLCRTVSKLHTVHTAYDPAPHNHNQHNQCRTPYAVIHGLVRLMMGIMMPEKCWDRSLIINIGLVASCWFISLQLYSLCYSGLIFLHLPYIFSATSRYFLTHFLTLRYKIYFLNSSLNKFPFGPSVHTGGEPTQPSTQKYQWVNRPE